VGENLKYRYPVMKYVRHFLPSKYLIAHAGKELSCHTIIEQFLVVKENWLKPKSILIPLFCYSLFRVLQIPAHNL